MAQYIVRIDDACPTMNHKKWKLLEDLFDKYNIKPVVAVIPNNKDTSLHIDYYDDRFWEKVRLWNDKGWTIAMHGNTHVMRSTNKKNLLLPFYNRCEFADMDLNQQLIHIKESWRTFIQEGITPKVWIAPAHCFDKTTLNAIKKETEIKIISDGIATSPYFDMGFYWIPQQLWQFSKKNFGLWTICLHPNTMSEKSIRNLEYEIIKYKSKIISLDNVKLKKNGKNFYGKLHSFLFWMRRREFLFAMNELIK